MRIAEEYIDYGNDNIEINSAKYIGDFAIRIIFKDGKENLVDFKPFIQKSNHPSITKYKQENIFLKFQIKNGNLLWGDYELIFPIWDLYQGKIE